MGQPYQPVGNLGVLVAEPGSIPVAGLADTETHADQPHADVMKFYRQFRHLTSMRWPYNFPSRAALRIAALMRSLTYIFLIVYLSRQAQLVSHHRFEGAVLGGASISPP